MPRDTESESIESDKKKSKSSNKKKKHEKRKHKHRKHHKEKHNKHKRHHSSSSSREASPARSEKKKVKKSRESANADNTEIVGPVIPTNLEQGKPSMVPMTKAEWEKQQNVTRRVYDEETGRHRLIKGDGEILEEIVSKKRHMEINRQATTGDGNFFQNKLGLTQDK